MLARLEGLGLGATRALSLVGLVALMALAGMTLADGLARWLANAPIEGVRDVGALVIAVAVSCCLPAGLMQRSHISIRIAGMLSERLARWLDFIAALAVWAVCIAMAWQFTLFAGKLAHAHETTWILKIPVAPFWYVVAAILWASAIVQAIVVLLDAARTR